MRSSLLVVLGVAAAAAVMLIVGSNILRGAGVQPNSDFDPRFVGMWDLVSFESYPSAGETIVNDYTARLIYDESGTMAAVGMPSDLPARESDTDGPTRAGFAYFGPVTVHGSEGYIVHHVTGSPMAPAWVGGDQVRYFEFDGELLKLSLRNEEGRTTGTLTWRPME